MQMQWFCSTTTISTLKSVEKRSAKPQNQKATHRMCARIAIGAAARPAHATLVFTRTALRPRRRAHRSGHRLDASSRWRKTVNAPGKIKKTIGRKAETRDARHLVSCAVPCMSGVPRAPFQIPHRQTPDRTHTTEVCSGCIAWAAPGPAQASQARHTSEPGPWPRAGEAPSASRATSHTSSPSNTRHSGRHDTCN